jgi:glycine/D-amino acid oxidase-like deaminating enzyme
MKKYDRIVLGAGMYGLYAAVESAKKGYNVLVIDLEDGPFQRGSYINQARLHNGYHYPRSFSTASKSCHYFDRFMNDFEDCINTEFTKVYAVAAEYSWANGNQFSEFCKKVGIPCDEIDNTVYFNQYTVDKAFLAKEHSFDASLLKEKLF